MGWLTNPKKAAYNRVYNRTTVDLGRLLKGPSRSARTVRGGSSAGGGLGCLIVVAGGGAVAAGPVGWLIAGLVVIGWVVFAHLARQQKQSQAAAALLQRQAELTSRFSADIANRILSGSVWQGASTSMIVESLGPPVDIKERVLKTKTKTTYCYRPIGRNRYALKVHFENGLVVGWDQA